MAEFASNAKGNAALTTGIIGTAGTGLALLNGLGGILGGGMACAPCSENTPVNRYEAEKDAKIAKLESDLALRDATAYILGETGKLRDYFEAKFDRVECQLSDQKAYNAANNATIGCISNQIAQLFSITKIVVPNTSVCPGWGNVTITPAATPTTTG